MPQFAFSWKLDRRNILKVDEFVLTNILESNLAGLKALERTMAKQFLFDNPMTEFYKLSAVSTIWTKLDKQGLIFKITDQPEEGYVTHLDDHSRKILNGFDAWDWKKAPKNSWNRLNLDFLFLCLFLKSLQRPTRLYSFRYSDLENLNIAYQPPSQRFRVPKVYMLVFMKSSQNGFLGGGAFSSIFRGGGRARSGRLLRPWFD